MNLNIPGYKNLQIEKIVFDLNGTIACDGSLIKGVKAGINSLAEEFEIYILTADTFGTASELLTDLKAELVIIDSTDGSKFKADLISREINDVLAIISKPQRLKATLRK